MSVKDFFATLGKIVTGFVAGVVFIFTCLFISKKKDIPEGIKKTDDIEKDCDKKKKDTLDEIKKTDSSDLAHNSSDFAGIQSGIEKLQEDSTGRIRDRIKQKL